MGEGLEEMGRWADPSRGAPSVIVVQGGEQGMEGEVLLPGSTGLNLFLIQPESSAALLMKEFEN